jgi:hypothetical protein
MFPITMRSVCLCIDSFVPKVDTRIFSIPVAEEFLKPGCIYLQLNERCRHSKIDLCDGPLAPVDPMEAITRIEEVPLAALVFEQVHRRVSYSMSTRYLK